jgi:capsular polysaccharide biosynthesis protein
VELSVEDLYPEQVVLLTRTAVLVGIHGAALTNQMWMRPHRGAVVEFGAGGNFHYLNMAAELGHKHFPLDGPNVEALTTAVQQAMDHVSAKYHAQP